MKEGEGMFFDTPKTNADSAHSCHKRYVAKIQAHIRSANQYHENQYHTLCFKQCVSLCALLHAAPLIFWR